MNAGAVVVAKSFLCSSNALQTTDFYQDTKEINSDYVVEEEKYCELKNNLKVRLFTFSTKYT